MILCNNIVKYYIDICIFLIYNAIHYNNERNRCQHGEKLQKNIKKAIADERYEDAAKTKLNKIIFDVLMNPIVETYEITTFEVIN